MFKQKTPMLITVSSKALENGLFWLCVSHAREKKMTSSWNSVNPAALLAPVHPSKKKETLPLNQREREIGEKKQERKDLYFRQVWPLKDFFAKYFSTSSFSWLRLSPASLPSPHLPPTSSPCSIPSPIWSAQQPRVCLIFIFPFSNIMKWIEFCISHSFAGLW